MSLRKGILWSFTGVLVVICPGVAFAQLAPQSQEEFEQRFTGWTVQSDAPDCNEGDGIDPITFIEPGRFDVNGFFEGDYEYERTGANTGTLTVTLDFFPIPQVLDLTFNSQTMGTFTVAAFGLVACEGSFEFVDASGTSDLTSYKYIFPQFAFGGGWESTLMVQALGSNTTCIFSAQDRSFTMRDPYGNNLSGTQQQLILGMNGWTILKTATPQGMAASSGMAVLDCDEEVSANTLFSLEVGGSLVAEALVESSEEIVPGEPAAQFLADQRDGARFAVAVANPSDRPLDVLVSVGDLDGQIVEEKAKVPANAAQAFFVDELVTIPAGHTGQVLIRPSNNPGPSVYVVGLRVTGLVITTIPAIVLRPDPPTTSPPNDLFSNARTISGPSGRATGSNVGATDETGEPGSGSGSVWWQWQAPSSGTVTIDTIGSSFDTVLGVYTGTRVDALRTLGEDDDGVEFFGASRVTLTVTAGTAYMLRVSGFGSSEGSIVLNWNLER